MIDYMIINDLKSLQRIIVKLRLTKRDYLMYKA